MTGEGHGLHPAVHELLFYGRDVLAQDIVALAAAHEERGYAHGLWANGGEDGIEVSPQALHIHAPVQLPFILPIEVLQQELHHTGLFHALRDVRLNVLARATGAEVGGAQGLDDVRVVVRMLLRADIDHHQVLQQLGPALREEHGSLAAHAVANEHDVLQPKAGDQRMHIGGHGGIRSPFGVRRTAMVAQVNEQHVERRCAVVGLAQLFADAAPIVAGAEEAVQDHHGSGSGHAKPSVMQIDRAHRSSRR